MGGDFPPPQSVHRLNPTGKGDRPAKWGPWRWNALCSVPGLARTAPLRQLQGGRSLTEHLITLSGGKI